MPPIEQPTNAVYVLDQMKSKISRDSTFFQKDPTGNILRNVEALLTGIEGPLFNSNGKYQRETLVPYLELLDVFLRFYRATQQSN